MGHLGVTGAHPIWGRRRLSLYTFLGPAFQPIRVLRCATSYLLSIITNRTWLLTNHCSASESRLTNQCSVLSQRWLGFNCLQMLSHFPVHLTGIRYVLSFIRRVHTLCICTRICLGPFVPVAVGWRMACCCPSRH